VQIRKAARARGRKRKTAVKDRRYKLLTVNCKLFFDDSVEQPRPLSGIPDAFSVD
jgi:hypothetical protein